MEEKRDPKDTTDQGIDERHPDGATPDAGGDTQGGDTKRGDSEGKEG